MKFQVDIPDDVFWRVAARAETFDMRVPDYAAEVLISAAGKKNIPDLDPLVACWRQGATDREIARRFGMTNAAVATRRRGYGLPANRKPRGASSG